MSYDKEMTERDELVERVASILENMPECHGLSSVKILALTRAAIAECQRFYLPDAELMDAYQAVQAQCAEMRIALEYARPLIIKWASYQGDNLKFRKKVLSPIDSALSTDAGQKVLDVIEAAKAVFDWEDGTLGQNSNIIQLREALSALGWKP